MTTIAFHYPSQIICTDSFTTTHDCIVTAHAKKYFDVEQGRVFATGNCAEIYHLKKHWNDGEFKPIMCEFFMVDKHKKIFFGEVRRGFKYLEPLEQNWAIGSGAKWAIAAMDFGKDAVEALSYACTRDKSTGGALQSFNVKGCALSKRERGSV
ncbi:proteasome subunit alpha [Pseudoalteromonas aurantia]|uniref:Proteasome subunit alpha n=1 Tax=Pseudoalteromonas aurantia TaxID=43654 RepID=A0A5S3V2I6_9GAMM|nr:proteasome subunit alpha [Pseudoalteromonas aurantia]TMO59369.1 proteasome subunit alpha [Pseudoalteromonas aurantia]TMO65008.1 proteasome subunit alpha [Pseudoalteromonas aurantia]TMO73608.1 proteasome subunit alpha [Pseudoalteromonas aurantia]